MHPAEVARILAAKQHDPEADTTAWEREIDWLVYRLYDLTLEEIKIVEESGQRRNYPTPTIQWWSKSQYDQGT